MYLFGRSIARMNEEINFNTKTKSLRYVIFNQKAPDVEFLEVWMGMMGLRFNVPYLSEQHIAV